MRVTIVISMCGLLTWMMAGCRSADPVVSAKPQPALSAAGFVDIQALVSHEPDYRLVRATDEQLDVLKRASLTLAPQSIGVDIGSLAPGTIRLDASGPPYSRTSFEARLDDNDVLLRDQYRRRSAKFDNASLEDRDRVIMAEVQSDYDQERRTLADSTSENLVKILGAEADKRIILEMQIATLKIDSAAGDSVTALTNVSAVCPSGAANHYLEFVQVVVVGTVTPPFHCPGTPTSYSLRSTSVMEVEQ